MTCNLAKAEKAILKSFLLLDVLLFNYLLLIIIINNMQILLITINNICILLINKYFVNIYLLISNAAQLLCLCGCIGLRVFLLMIKM